MKGPHIIFVAFFLAAVVSPLHAQDSVRIELSLTAASPAIETAKGFDEVRAKSILSCKPFSGSSSYRFQQENDSLWSIRLPKGGYFIQLESYAFHAVNRYVSIASDTSLILALELDSLPYCYENGTRFNYIPAGIAFEQSLWLRFKEGAVAENQAWLEAQLPLRRLELLAPNVFYITLRLEATKTVEQLLYERKYGALDLGCYIGDALRDAIEKIQTTGRLAYANPRWHWVKP